MFLEVILELRGITVTEKLRWLGLWYHTEWYCESSVPDFRLLGWHWWFHGIAVADDSRRCQAVPVHRASWFFEMLLSSSFRLGVHHEAIQANPALVPLWPTWERWKKVPLGCYGLDLQCNLDPWSPGWVLAATSILGARKLPQPVFRRATASQIISVCHALLSWILAGNSTFVHQ